jgi:hypothetical protein
MLLVLALLLAGCTAGGATHPLAAPAGAAASPPHAVLDRQHARDATCRRALRRGAPQQRRAAPALRCSGQQQRARCEAGASGSGAAASCWRQQQ